MEGKPLPEKKLATPAEPEAATPAGKPSPAAKPAPAFGKSGQEKPAPA